MYRCFYFPVILDLTKGERALHAYIRFIIKKNLSITAVEDKEFRELSKFNDHFSVNRIKEIILKLVEVVQEKITCVCVCIHKELSCMSDDRIMVQIVLRCMEFTILHGK